MNVLDPCGQVMDVLRSCFKGKMRFREGDDPVTVTWFFCRGDAAIFERPTIFRGTDFESTPYNNSGLGQQYPPRGSWRNGQRPALLAGMVSCLEFDPQWWETGIPADEVVNLPRTEVGEPLCCIDAALGLRFGGQAKVSVVRPKVVQFGLLFGGSASLVPVSSGTGLLFGGSSPPLPEAMRTGLLFGGSAGM